MKKIDYTCPVEFLGPYIGSKILGVVAGHAVIECRGYTVLLNPYGQDPCHATAVRQKNLITPKPGDLWLHGAVITDERGTMIHGQNGWKLIFRDLKPFKEEE